MPDEDVAALSSSPPYGRSLPLGVAILAVLIGLVGLLYLFLGVVVLFLHLAASGFLPHFGGGVLGALVLLVIGIVLLLVARGLWDLELWALVLCILVLGALWVGDLLEGAWFSLGGLILLVLLVYLVAVHRHFR